MKKSARKKKESFFKTAIDVKSEPEEKKTPKMKKIFTNKPLLIGLITIIIILVGAGGVYWFLKLEDSKTVGNPTLNSAEIKALIAEIGEKIVLPKDETPTIATVTDVEKLSEQPFFKNAKNGDKVVIYGSTREAILYRPSIHKIITMAPINNTAIASPSPSVSPQAATSGTPTISPTVTPAAKIKVAILNSTKEAGLAKKAGTLLDDKVFEIVGTANANGEYETTTVSLVKTAKDVDVKKIVSAFSDIKASAKALPSDESALSSAEIVIILGSDFSDAY